MKQSHEWKWRDVFSALCLHTVVILNRLLFVSASDDALPLCSSTDGLYTRPSEETIADSCTLESIHLFDLSGILESHCVLLCIPPCSSKTLAVLSQVSDVFAEDSHVFVGMLIISSHNSSDIVWKESSHQNSELAFYEQEPRDRTCLLSPRKTKFKAEPYIGRITLNLLVQFLNEKCGAYRTITGGLNSAGLFHSYIMNNLYHPKESVVECTRISVPDQPTFFQQFLFRSRPVIIEDGVKNWPAMRRWTKEYLKNLYGSKKVHVKMTKDGNFEGVERASLWSDYHEDWIPDEVRLQLPFPDLVVVRPATADILFSDFVDFISSENRSYSAYLEYSSIPFHLPLLEEDIEEMPFLNGLLERRHLNIWLSDGNTLGKLHFDPFDNFLCQVRCSLLSMHVHNSS